MTDSKDNNSTPEESGSGMGRWFGFGKKKAEAEGVQEQSAHESEVHEDDAPTLPSSPQLTEERIAEAERTAQQQTAPAAVVPVAAETVPASAVSEGSDEEEVSFFDRMKTGLSKTRSSFSTGLANILVGKKEIDDEIFEDIETQLLVSDVGVEATRTIIDELTARVGRNELIDADALYEALQEELAKLLDGVEAPLEINAANQPTVILMVGVNGVGKTTTIGKLAKKFQREGKSVMLAAGDTFRAAAVEQLQVWGERNDVTVVAQHTGADSASVIFDAVEAAKSRGTDIIIADTAGRLHNKSHLMEELKKVLRVMQKLDVNAPHEVMLVLDAGTGQNAVNQVAEFSKAVKVSGLVITKMDGTAKGGVVFALARQFNIPIRFVGVGEKIDDLRPFEARPFVKALFAE